jgi:hypothetical protein
MFAARMLHFLPAQALSSEDSGQAQGALFQNHLGVVHGRGAARLHATTKKSQTLKYLER